MGEIEISKRYNLGRRGPIERHNNTPDERLPLVALNQTEPELLQYLAGLGQFRELDRLRWSSPNGIYEYVALDIKSAEGV